MTKSSSIRCLWLALFGTLAMTNAFARGTIDMQAPTTLSETYDAWTVQCVNSGEGDQKRRSCQMSQELHQQGSRQRVLLFAITKAEGSAIATLVLPFGLLLSEGVRIEAAETEVVRGGFRTCLPAGCVAEIDLSEEAIGQLQSGDTVSVSMTANSGQVVTTEVSLKGFTAAYQRLTELVVS